MSKSAPKPDNYRLRMVGLHWFVKLFHGDKCIETLGPFTHKEAESKAESLNLRDADRL